MPEVTFLNIHHFFSRCSVKRKVKVQIKLSSLWYDLDRPLSPDWEEALFSAFGEIWWWLWKVEAQFSFFFYEIMNFFKIMKFKISLLKLVELKINLAWHLSFSIFIKNAAGKSMKQAAKERRWDSHLQNTKGLCIYQISCKNP